MLSFLIAGETCVSKAWFISTARQNALSELTQEKLEDVTLKNKQTIQNSNCGLTPAWLTTYIFNKPTHSYYSLWPQEAFVLPVALNTISAWPRQAGAASSGSSQPSHLLPDQTKPPGMHPSALCSYEGTHDMWTTKGQKGISEGGHVCLPARPAREYHLTSSSVNTPLSHGS